MKTPKPQKLPSGNWRIRLQIDGKRYSITKPTKDEVKEEARKLYAGFEIEKRSPMTVGQAIDRYISEKSKILSPYTIKGYNTIRRNYFQSIMNLNLTDLEQRDIQRAIMLDQVAGKSPKTIKNAHGLLTATLSEYRPKFHVESKLPKLVKTERDIFSEEDMAKVWQAAKGDKYELAILLASWFGLRMSEVRGLKFGDISINNPPHCNTMHIHRARIRVKGQDIDKTPKTAAGNRRIILPDLVFTLILKETQKHKAPCADDYICPYSISAINKGFIRICKKAGVEPCRFHDLRHFAASVSLALGVPDKYSMKRMGHATENMLKTTYQHTMKSKEEEYADLVDAHMETLYNGSGHENGHEEKKGT